MHLYLMGYRGSGKSSVGRMLAHQLDRPLVDTDEAIEKAAKQSISQIFATEGEAGFRDREQVAIATVAAIREPCVIALGGGAILRPANRQAIRQSGHVVWLQGSPEYLFARIQGDATTAARRPNLSPGGGYSEVVEILAVREPLYRQLAEKTIATDPKTPDEIAAEIAAWVNSKL
ncbi:MAG: shikimate kinase [Planctomycetales bacterium]|nr:shikimate kinase [Planctomycetales bacterium]